MKEGQSGLAGGEPVIGISSLVSIFAYFPFVVLPVAAPRAGTTAMLQPLVFIFLSLFSTLAFAFCPSVFSIKFFFI